MSTATEHTDATPASGPRPRSPNFPRASAWDLLWWCKGPKEWAPAPLDADIERCLSVGPWLLAEKAVASVMVGGLWESDVLRDTPQTFIAEAAGVSLRVLARVLNVFEMAGVIVRLPKSAGSPRGELTAYRIDMERLRAWAGKPRPAEWGGPKRGKSGRPGASVAAVRDRTNEIQAAMRRAGASVDDPAWRQALKLAKRLDRIATRTARAEQAEARRLTAKREADDRRRAEHEKVSALLATSLAGIPSGAARESGSAPGGPRAPRDRGTYRRCRTGDRASGRAAVGCDRAVAPRRAAQHGERGSARDTAHERQRSQRGRGARGRASSRHGRQAVPRRVAAARGADNRGGRRACDGAGAAAPSHRDAGLRPQERLLPRGGFSRAPARAAAGAPSDRARGANPRDAPGAVGGGPSAAREGEEPGAPSLAPDLRRQDLRLRSGTHAAAKGRE